MGSNLLRIFLKSVLELRSFERAICSYFQRSGLSLSSQDFYEWLISFNINCRNYVKMSEVKRILDDKEPADFKKTFMMLLKIYCGGKGLLHSLTSRRMEKGAACLHVSGLRQLWEDVLTLSN